MTPERRVLVAASAAGIVMIGALAVILAFGQLHHPQFPALADEPDPAIEGTVEFVRWERDSQCWYEVPASGGEPRLIDCDRARDPRPPRGDPWESEDGTRLETGGTDGTARLTARDDDGETRVLLEVQGPRDYGFWEAQWSPDGEWVLVVDAAQRLLVVPADGGGDARLLAEDASAPHWRR